MDDLERTAMFFKAIEGKDFHALSSLLSDDFRYYGPMPDPFVKEVWLDFQRAVQLAFPDWAYNLKKIEKRHNAIEVIVEITGTHLQELSLPWQDVKPIAATGNKIHLPEEKATLKFKDGKLYELRVHSPHHGGLPGLLEQLRAE